MAIPFPDRAASKIRKKSGFCRSRKRCPPGNRKLDRRYLAALQMLRQRRRKTINAATRQTQKTKTPRTMRQLSRISSRKNSKITNRFQKSLFRGQVHRPLRSPSKTQKQRLQAVSASPFTHLVSDPGKKRSSGHR